MGQTQKELLTDARAKAVGSGYVKLTGNETVSGVKTFASSPVVPAPTSNLQASTKKYVDDAEAAAKAYVDATILTKKVSLTSAQILAIQTGAIELIAAPGANKAVVVHDILFNYKRGAASYTDAGGACTIKQGANAIHNLADLSALVIAGASAATYLQMKDNVAMTANAAVTINKATNNFAAGDGTIDIHIRYSVIAL